VFANAHGAMGPKRRHSRSDIERFTHEHRRDLSAKLAERRQRPVSDHDWERFVHYTVSLLQTELSEQNKAQADGDALPRVKSPDLLFKDPAYKPTEKGRVRANDPFPETEGYRPPHGYFTQSSGCDQVMRMWMDGCAFIDNPQSIYYMTPDKLFPPGGVDAKTGVLTTSTYIGNVMKKNKEDEPRSRSHQQFVEAGGGGGRGGNG